MLDFGSSIEVFTTCPQSKDFMPAEYLRRAVEIASWSDDAGCAGMLIYTDNGTVARRYRDDGCTVITAAVDAVAITREAAAQTGLARD